MYMYVYVYVYMYMYKIISTMNLVITRINITRHKRLYAIIIISFFSISITYNTRVYVSRSHVLE